MKTQNVNLNFPVFVIREMGTVSGDSSDFDYLELKKTAKVESEGVGILHMYLNDLSTSPRSIPTLISGERSQVWKWILSWAEERLPLR